MAWQPFLLGGYAQLSSFDLMRPAMLGGSSNMPMSTSAPQPHREYGRRLGACFCPHPPTHPPSKGVSTQFRGDRMSAKAYCGQKCRLERHARESKGTRECPLGGPLRLLPNLPEGRKAFFELRLTAPLPEPYVSHTLLSDGR